jgi:hypothetical protein
LHGFFSSAACSPVEKCETLSQKFVEDMKKEKVTVTTIEKAMEGWKQGAQAAVQAAVLPAASFKVQDSMALMDVDPVSM